MTNVEEVDVLIVGQGLAGTAMAFRCMLAHKRFLVVDAGLSKAASYHAAGVINPITGRRFAKSWMYETLEAEFLPFYEKLSAHLGNTSYLSSKPIFRLKDTVQNINDWDVRAAWASHTPFLCKESYTPRYAAQGSVFGKIIRSYQLMVVRLLQDFRALLVRENALLAEKFDYQKWDTDKMTYGRWRAKKIIFCEGVGILANPWFNWLPMKPAKGEILHVDIPKGDVEILYKCQFYIAHLQDTRYWYGATYDHEELSPEPTDAKKVLLLKKLKEELHLPHTVLEHRCALRPTVPDRKPYLGSSPTHSNHYVFNGMGSKGSSMVPHFSKILFEYMYENGSLPSEVDIKRIENI